MPNQEENTYKDVSHAAQGIKWRRAGTQSLGACKNNHGADLENQADKQGDGWT